MVYAAWKVLRLPFYIGKHWTTTRDGILMPACVAGIIWQTALMWKYTTLTTEQEKITYNDYPTATDPLAARDQKYYSMYIKQQGIDITDPAFTGMDRATLEAQINSA